MSPLKIAILITLGFFPAGASHARIWTNKDGRQIEAEFVEFDEAGGKVTIKQGDKRHTIALETLSEDDRKWIAGHVAALEGDKDDAAEEEAAKEGEPAGASDPILLLLNKSPDEVTAALKTLKMVEDMGTMETSKRQNLKDGSLGVQHSYDSGKVKFEFFGDKLITINLSLMDGYSGAMPLGLKKDISQQDAKEILSGKGFTLVDYGTSPPGWGLAHRMNISPSKVVAVITMEPQSPELAIIRIMEKK